MFLGSMDCTVTADDADDADDADYPYTLGHGRIRVLFTSNRVSMGMLIIVSIVSHKEAGLFNA